MIKVSRFLKLIGVFFIILIIINTLALWQLNHGFNTERRIASEEIAKTIESIAEQTNLLALNAVIEAARASDSGRGFAVVSGEIRKLAEQSGHFTEEITLIIRELIEKTESAIDVMEDMNKIVQDQRKSVEFTNIKFLSIASAIGESRIIINRLNLSGPEIEKKERKIIPIIEHLSATSQENAAGTEQASASLEELTASMEEFSSTSEVLTELAQNLQSNVEKFQY